ncbi:MAG: c-type cytochrome, partial [Pseudomonadales bacterium]
AAGFAEHCAECHSIDARTRVRTPAPNLAGIVDRHHLAAGWLRNDPETRRRWLRDHQQIKPGNRMPDHAHLDPQLLDAIAGFLEQQP